MSDLPVGRTVVCPECGADAVAIVPRGSAIVERAEVADGKVWVNCRSCDHRFVAHYANDR